MFSDWWRKTTWNKGREEPCMRPCKARKVETVDQIRTCRVHERPYTLAIIQTLVSARYCVVWLVLSTKHFKLSEYSLALCLFAAALRAALRASLCPSFTSYECTSLGIPCVLSQSNVTGFIGHQQPTCQAQVLSSRVPRSRLPMLSHIAV